MIQTRAWHIRPRGLTATYLHLNQKHISHLSLLFTAGLCSSSVPSDMRSSFPVTMLNTSLRRVARHCPNCNRPSTPTPITASFSSQTHQRRHSSSKRPVPPSSNDSSIPAAQVKAVATKNKSDIQAKGIPEAPAVKDAETSGTIDVTKKRPGTESRLSHRREHRSKKDYSNEWLLNVPSVAPTNHLKREGIHSRSTASTNEYSQFFQTFTRHPSTPSTARSPSTRHQASPTKPP